MPILSRSILRKSKLLMNQLISFPLCAPVSSECMPYGWFMDRFSILFSTQCSLDLLWLYWQVERWAVVYMSFCFQMRPNFCLFFIHEYHKLLDQRESIQNLGWVEKKKQIQNNFRIVQNHFDTLILKSCIQWRKKSGNYPISLHTMFEKVLVTFPRIYNSSRSIVVLGLCKWYAANMKWWKKDENNEFQHDW